MSKKYILYSFIFLCAFTISAQTKFKAIVKDSATNEPLTGVTVLIKETTIGGSTDANGFIELQNVPDGKQVLIFSFLGYNQSQDSLEFPLSDTATRVFYIKSEAGSLEEIIVEGTRSNRSIENIPTRVEVLTEEIDEASTMDPSKVAHLLTHSTGIQVQQTSATSNMANVRIQGLDGRYTQILKDGFPNYGGFSGSLSIMQIPPLDLRQVEYIKGSASTLYGAGAIAGLINLISKEADKEETLIHLNASHVGALDVNTFLSRKIGKIGFTLLAQRNTHQYFDADKDGYTDLPQLTKYNFNPKLFFYFNKRTKLTIGGTFTSETREGGDTRLLRNEAPDSVHFYKEANDINRVTTQFKLEHKLSENNTIGLRNSFNVFKRTLQITSSPILGQYRFAGDQLSSFSELSFTNRHKQNVFIAGLNFYSEDFKEEKLQSLILRNEEYQTAGLFLNYTFDLGEKVAIESGVRTDYVIHKQAYVLPRLSALFKWSRKLTTRIGGGMGYRNASIFNQEAELLGYKDIMPIDKTLTNAEQSYGASADIGFKTTLGEHFFLNINQMFFYNYIEKPLILADTNGISGVYHFVNANGYTQSYGAETFFKFGFYDFVLFVGYTYTNASNIINGYEAPFTLTPVHSLKGDLLYALPGKWRIGLDYEFKSEQYLSPGKYSPSYWTYGAIVEYTIKQFTLFGNVENFTNVRQTNYESLKSGPYDTPQFTPVWAPLDGIVFNAGIKIRL
ncbi:MAG: collagen-binding protein [Bacteroidota bacterium]|nr:collagen-binding protein [Bacteroidota bacterium]